MLLKSYRQKITSLLLLACLVGITPLATAALIKRSDFQTFVDDMAERHQFNPKLLTRLFADVQKRQDILDAISRPAEGKPWYQYRPIFIKQSRIQGGVDFWQQHEATLARAEQIYGIPPQIIIAIIGVETRYGQHTGNYRVLDSLSTLAFHYPPRSSFFLSELEQFLLLAREEQIDPTSVKGSYAGAMGQPQFISSSYRRYAVDFDGDGKRDLWNNTDDVIGSVAHYFYKHGWRPGQPIAFPVEVKGKQYQRLVDKGIKPETALKQFKRHGIKVPAGYISDYDAALLEFELEQGHEYWAGLKNFYVITRYNHSALYAMAVYQLSEEIVEQRRIRNAQPKTTTP